MHHERRSKHAQERRQRTPTPPESPSEPTSSSTDTPSHTSSHHTTDYFDSEVSSTPSGDYTDRADEYAATHFPVPTRCMFGHFDTLRSRRFENTRRVDFETLRVFRIEEQFLLITGRIGFTLAFWSIDRPSYKKLTHEFLSSLQLMTNTRGRPYIKFRLLHEPHRVWVSQLREWFGFQPDPQTTSLEFREGLDKDHFWNLVSGMEPGAVHNREFKGLNIPHSVLRCIQRALAVTIFARGETVARANVEDLQLLDHMLCPDGELERPDLMLIMIHHWLNLQRSTRFGGSITISTYVTLIADRLEVPTADDELCRGPRLLDAEAFRLAKFIKIEKGTAGHRDRHLWCMPDESTRYPMPFSALLSFEDRNTWLFIGPPAAQFPSPPPHVPDEPMPDATSSPPLAHASTSAAAASHPTDPTI